MKKIPTIFVRQWTSHFQVLPQFKEECEWVASGEGVATRKYDGTSCLVKEGKLYKRYEDKGDGRVPEDFEPADDVDPETGKRPGWVPVGIGPEDKWHREAFERSTIPPDGTYELLGPKIQGNPEGLTYHMLMPHNRAQILEDCPRDYDALKIYLLEKDIEGIVWHHPDGRMAKIKKRDFGMKRVIK